MATKARKPLQPQPSPSKTSVKKQPASFLLNFPNSKTEAERPSSPYRGGAASSDPWSLDSGWEIIVYRLASGARTSFARLVSPVCLVDDECLHIEYQTWQPRCSSTRKLLPEQQLSWCLDQSFSSSVFSLEIFGRTVSGKPFAWPDGVTFDGATAASALKQQQQRQEYIQEQRARFQALTSTERDAAQAATQLSEVVLIQGNRLERATLAFNTAGELPVVCAVKLSVPIIAGGSAANEGAGAGYNSALAQPPAAAARPEPSSIQPLQDMATSVVSLVSASPVAAAAHESTSQNTSCPPGQIRDAGAGSVGATEDVQGSNQRIAQTQHDGGVLEPPQTALQEGRGTEPAGAAPVKVAKQPSPAATGLPPQALASGQLVHDITQPPMLTSSTQSGTDQLLSNGKRHQDASGIPRNGKLPSAYMQMQTDAEQQGRQQVGQPRAPLEPQHISRRSTDGGILGRDSNVQLSRIAVSHDSENYEGMTAQQRQGTPLGSSPVLADLPGPTRNYAGSTNSLDSYASSHSSMHGGQGRGHHGGRGWGAQQQHQQHGGHQGSSMAGGRRASRGSYGNLQSATGSMGGGKAPYQGRNGTYAAAAQQQGRMVMLQGGGPNRMSMDDMLIGQQGHGGGHGRGMSRIMDLGGSSQSLSGAQEANQSQQEPGTPEPTGATDLERLLSQVTPMINLDCSRQPPAEALQALCLEDLWRFYLEPSLYGREIYTLGGARGPSLSYYVPYMSAMQLFTPASPKDPGTQRLYISDTDGWPKHMHLRYELFESELPFNRHPMYEQIDQISKHMESVAKAASQHAKAAMAEQPASQQQQQQSGASSPTAGAAGGSVGGAAPLSSRAPSPGGQSAAGLGSNPGGQTAVADGGQAASDGGSPGVPDEDAPPTAWLKGARILDLHPASWYCIAWYPVYRVPDAPLNTRFLTFHSFAPLVANIQNAVSALREGQQRHPSSLPMNVVGLKWNNMHGERWLEPLTLDGETVTSLLRHDDEHSSGGYGAGRGGRRGGYGQRPVDVHFQAHISELQATAERLARGHSVRVLGPMGVEECRQRHPDYEFFNSRG